jgi:phospholipase/carboxylesterase
MVGHQFQARGIMTSGLHHVTLITRKVQANVDFYAGFLGLRLVKRTAGFEDATQLHLFYGDAEATPGSLVTFLVWEDGAPGRVGHGAPGEISFAIHPQAIGFWLTRALRFGVKATGPAPEFGEPVLRLTDPDGVIVKLVGVSGIEDAKPWVIDDISADDAIQRLHGATIFSEKPEETAGFLASHTGFAERVSGDTIIRLGSDAGGVIDVRNASGFWTAAPGTGTIDHIAVRAPDRPYVETMAATLDAEGHGPVNAHDRKYFYSLYVREPQGTLIELATDTPGFMLDESLETLGLELFIPPHFAKDDADIRAMLPQFGLPGEPRTLYRELPFIHRIHEPDAPDGSTVITLHGTGGNEASLLPLAHRLFAHATLIGLRGRSTEEGVARFFGRFDPTTFNQKDIASEAEAFEAFVEGAIEAYHLDAANLTFLGYSNGANMLGAAMLLHPGLIRRAVLIRPMMVLDAVPPADLTGTKVLLLSGARDPYLSYAAPLEQVLLAAGAALTNEVIDTGHGLSAEDEVVAARWLKDSAE